MWLKYDSAPIMLGEQFNRDQSDYLGEYAKPHGFWITDDSEDCWRRWCIENSFGQDRLTHKHEIILDESRILIMRSGREIDDFTQKYAVQKSWGPEGEPRKYRDLCIDWRMVAQQYAGIIITPYQWSRRLDAGYGWYYPWDCASGCIWSAAAIADIRLIEIDPDVVNAKPDWAEAEVAA